MEIKISKCSASCQVCERAFVHEEKIHSVAQSVETGLERFDFCKSCYENNKSDEIFCAWECQYSDPRVAEAERQESFSPLRRLFYDLAASEEREALAQAFLAAQLLRRQRVFRHIRETEEEQGILRVSLYLDRAGNRLIETKDLNFSYSELDEARVLLLEALRELESPERGETEEADEAGESSPKKEAGEESSEIRSVEHAAGIKTSDDGQEQNHV
jgi:hypothetical protein